MTTNHNAQKCGLTFHLAEAGIAGARLLHFLCRLGFSSNKFYVCPLFTSWWHFLGKVSRDNIFLILFIHSLAHNYITYLINCIYLNCVIFIRVIFN